jgi:hypothetical protein
MTIIKIEAMAFGLLQYTPHDLKKSAIHLSIIIYTKESLT